MDSQKAVTTHNFGQHADNVFASIRSPISDYSTVLECICQSQKLAESSNRKHTHITVDTGAAAEFFPCGLEQNCRIQEGINSFG